MVNLNKIGNNVENGARKFISQMGKGGYAPIILLEATVVAGRTRQAKKRGGYTEARERLTEESLGSIFWLGGVAGFSKLFDIMGKKLMKLKNVNFDVGKDYARNPFQNYITKLKAGAKEIATNAHLEKNLAKFKFAKIITSVLLANVFMGIIVPKVNQAITRKQLKTKNAEKTPQTNPVQLQMAKTSFEEFLNKKNKNISFGGGIQGLLNATTLFEQSAVVKLLSTDVGTTSGRSINARNKDERNEILFRDLSSMYFYYCCRKHLNSVLNYIENGRTTRLDLVSAKQLDSHIRDGFKNESYSAEEFEKLVLGNKDAQIPANLQSKFKDGNKVVTLKEFREIVGKDSAEAKIATRMARLQPMLSIEVKDEKGISTLQRRAILTEAQVKDVYAKGLINDPKFLNNIYKQSTGKASTNPTKFVAEKELLKLKSEMVNYVQDIAQKAKTAGKDVTLDALKKANRQNFAKNAFNLGAGFAVAALFLSTLIPKMQYWMTRKKTGQDGFPGVK